MLTDQQLTNLIEHFTNAIKYHADAVGSVAEALADVAVAIESHGTRLETTLGTIEHALYNLDGFHDLSAESSHAGRSQAEALEKVADAIRDHSSGV